MKIGIAVCTFNRIETLRETVSKILSHTRSDYELIVIDDGSSDGTREQFESSDIKILSCRNRGIAWNKNRAIFYLKNFAKADAIIVIEDDTFPLEDGWEEAWVDAIGRWGHINLAARYWNGTECGLFHDGDGSPGRPYKCTHVSAQCSGFSAEAVDYVGYMDSRFRGWGMEHIEHTDRMIKAGFGGEYCNALNRRVHYLIDSNLEILFRDESVGLEESSKKASIAESLEISIALSGDKVRRDPWINDEEMAIFLSEFNKFRKEKFAFWIKTNENFGICYDRSKRDFVFLSNETLYQRAECERVMAYYDGRDLRLFIQPGEKVEFFSSDVSDGYVISNSDVDHLRFDVTLDKKSGLYLRRGDSYLTCDKANGYSVTLNRTAADDWERFYFSHFRLVGGELF